MKLDPAGIETSLYRTMSSAVIPRPIGWISTTSADGVDNLAPYSFFNVVSIEPPLLLFAPVDKSAEALKDSARNALETEAFVHNLVTRECVEAMNATSATLPPDESEFDAAGIERASSDRVTPPRVESAAIAFECELYDHLDVGGSTLILGEVVLVHVDDAVTTAGKVDIEKLDAVGRLAGEWYATAAERFRIERPP